MKFLCCGHEEVPLGLKPAETPDALRGAEAPLFHGTPSFRGALYSRPTPGFALRLRAFSSILLGLMFVLPVIARAQSAKYPQTIVFMTDFGVVDDSVAICRGVMYSIMPEVRIVDLTHQVTPFWIPDGARFLFGVTPYYPAGTVFVVVIDPGVGSTRKAIVAKSKRGQYFVLPDNGLLTLVERRDGIEGVHEITNPDWMIGTKLSSTFHGRDIFSPVGAHVARGDDWTKAGPEMALAGLVRLELEAWRSLMSAELRQR